MTSPTKATVTSLYAAQIGDTLPKLAQEFYGTSKLVSLLSAANNLDPAAILTLGQRIIIPPPPADESAPTADATPGETIDTIVVPGSTVVWYKDWRVWLTAAAIGGAIWYFARSRGSRKPHRRR